MSLFSSMRGAIWLCVVYGVFVGISNHTYGLLNLFYQFREKKIEGVSRTFADYLGFLDILGSDKRGFIIIRYQFICCPKISHRNTIYTSMKRKRMLLTSTLFFHSPTLPTG